MDYQDKLVLITGAARGIGRSVAQKFLKEGARVVLTDILTDQLMETAEELRHQAGGSSRSVYAFACDVSLSTAVSAFTETVMREAGVPDIVYNNAMFNRTGGILELDVANVERELRVNVLGYLQVSKAFLPAMIERGRGGWIVNTVSPNGIAPPPMVAANLLGYCVCKAAQISLSQCMAVALRPYNIGVTALFPDITLTEAIDTISGKASKEFEAGFATFLRNNSRSADEVAGEMVQKVKERKFFVNAYPGWEAVLVEWAKHGLDPNVDYDSL
ncbi:hypothetical protein BJY01DRAFT_255101 [Aspergillus pseudoustus]|uniref:Short chain dehydrogenase/reductase n=1 Tax=Aspergillus pseudoustus TaxID=1810923 RepID=A0ABR4IN19_9EURO